MTVLEQLGRLDLPIASGEAEYESIGREKSKAATELAYAEITSYSRKKDIKVKVICENDTTALSINTSYF